jgi:hypothetical protein
MALAEWVEVWEALSTDGYTDISEGFYRAKEDADAATANMGGYGRPSKKHRALRGPNGGLYLVEGEALSFRPSLTERERESAIRACALSKLTAAERKALGL